MISLYHHTYHLFSALTKTNKGFQVLNNKL